MRETERQRESLGNRGRLKPWFHTIEVSLVLKDHKKQKGRRRRKAHSKYEQKFACELRGTIALFNLLCFVSYSFVRTSSCLNREKIRKLKKRKEKKKGRGNACARESR